MRHEADLDHAKLPLLFQQARMVAKQLLEPVHDQAALLLHASIKGNRLCIVAKPSLQVPVCPCTHTLVLVICPSPNAAMLCCLLHCWS